VRRAIFAFRALRSQVDPLWIDVALFLPFFPFFAFLGLGTVVRLNHVNAERQAADDFIDELNRRPLPIRHRHRSARR
jgi:hypothetical protein